MKLSKFMHLGTLSSMTFLPIVISAGCQNDPNLDEEIAKLSKEQLQALIEKKVIDLDKEQKKALIDKLDPKNLLTSDEKAGLIEKLNMQAGNLATVVWYVNSVEARTGTLQSYALAKTVFDNITKDATNKLDIAKVDKSTGAVANPDADKFIPVVFMDIDETVFINAYSEAELMQSGEKFVEDKKDAIDALGKRKAVEGAVDFINHVYENGGIVMFNSNIRQMEKSVAGIKKNLEAVGVKKEYIQDWQFWCRGIKATNSDGTFVAKPWIQYKDAADFEAKIKADSSLDTKKNERMNSVSDNKNGWDLKQTDNISGDQVKMRVIMKVGDDFNDFYDSIYKKKSNEEKKKFLEKPEIKKLFTELNGAEGQRYDGKTGKLEKLDWKQFLVQTPGNSMYGGWTREYSYGNYLKLWNAIKQIIAENK